jgi:hypothetical protein
MPDESDAALTDHLSRRANGLPGPPANWLPFLREAGIASQCLTTGLATLRKANHAQHGLFNQAFFELSIGFERLLKLIVVIDHALEHDGIFPTNTLLKQAYGHDLEALFAKAKEIRERRSHEGLQWDLVDENIATRIIKVLSEFASSTRYYNLDVLTASGTSSNQRDPLAAWFDEVASVLLESYPRARRNKDTAFADFLDEVLGDHSAVRHTTEGGRPLSTIRDLALHEASMEHVQKEATFHCATIVRFLGEILAVLNHHSSPQGLIQIPFLSEFFAGFDNSNSYLKRRRTFT